MKWLDRLVDRVWAALGWDDVEQPVNNDEEYYGYDRREHY